MATAVCPICRQSDQIQKVTSITSTGTTHGAYGTKSELAQRLEPPRGPTKERVSNSGDLAKGVLVMCLALFLLIAFTQGAGETEGIGSWIVIGAGLAIALLLFSEGVRVIMKSNKEGPAKIQAAEKRFKEESLSWQNAMAKYDRSYYCFRDDQVFDPETVQHAAPQDLTKFLYEKESSAS